MKEVLILGGKGFIGSRLADLYISHGHRVSYTTKIHKDLNNNVIKSDYSKKSFLEIFNDRKYERIFFLSGNPYPGLSVDNCNLDLEQTFIPLVNAVEALKETSFEGNFWFASSVAVYGASSLELQSENDICKPLSNYAIIKLAGEEYLKMMSATSDLNLGSFRIFSTFGENLRRQLIFDIHQKIKQDQNKIFLFGSGEEIRDLSYVGDQVKRIKIVADNVKPDGDVYNIGSGEPTKIKSVAEEIVKIMGFDTKIIYTSKERVFDGNSWVADMKKFEKIAPNPEASFSESIKKTIISLENQK